MFCPNCRYEYVRGVYKCPDCGVDLVYALPPAPERPAEPDLDLAVVYAATNHADAALAKSILEDAGIEYITDGAWRSSGRITFLVYPKDAEAARALLADLH